MKNGSHGSRFVASIAALALGACSFMGMRPEPTRDPATGELTCSSTVTPALELLGGIALSVAGVYFVMVQNAIAECGEEGGCTPRFVGALPGTLLLGSSIYGFVADGKCQKALRRARADDIARAAAQAPLPVPE